MKQVRPARSDSRMSDVLQFGTDFAGLEIRGSRDIQEDSSLIRASASYLQLLVIVADGMGGHTAGEYASKVAVDTFDRSFTNNVSGTIPVRLATALQRANSEIAEAVRGLVPTATMGSTLIGAHLDHEGLQWISVGDSIILRYRKGKVRRLNVDHSMVPVIMDSFRAGKISEEEAANHPSRNVLRSALTGDALEMIDASKRPEKLLRGDVLIFATDGLLTLSEAEIGIVLAKFLRKPAGEIVNALMDAVVSRCVPTQDNTTIQVVVVPPVCGGRFRIRPWFVVTSWLMVVAVSLMALLLLGRLPPFSQTAELNRTGGASFKPSPEERSMPVVVARETLPDNAKKGSVPRKLTPPLSSGASESNKSFETSIDSEGIVGTRTGAPGLITEPSPAPSTEENAHSRDGSLEGPSENNGNIRPRAAGENTPANDDQISRGDYEHLR